VIAFALDTHLTRSLRSRPLLPQTGGEVLSGYFREAESSVEIPHQRLPHRLRHHGHVAVVGMVDADHDLRAGSAELFPLRGREWKLYELD
jgi:hypothetical protein